MDGQYANVGFSSFLAIGREATFKTYATVTAGLEFTKAKFITKKDSKEIDAVRNSRTMIDRIGLSRKVTGDVDFYMAADSDGCQYLLQNAMGGGVTGGTIISATGSGDTTGASAIEHLVSVAPFDVTYSSLCITHRKGDATNGRTFDYSGVRVDQLGLKAKVDDALMCNASMIIVDSTSTTAAAAAAAALFTPTMKQTPLNFTNMRFSCENSFNSLTAAAFWHVQSIDFSIKNNLKSDASARRIGSELLQVLPPGMASFELKVGMRWDTLTAYNAMLNETGLAAQMSFQGPTITGSKLPYEMRIDLPRVYIKDAGDPEVSGPDEILKSEITFMVLQDNSTTTGYACKTMTRNTTASY